MSVPFENKKIVLSLTFILICCVSFANDNLFKQARALQREGKYQESITAFKDYLTQPIREKNLSNEQMLLYTEALVQLMNTYQSKGEPEACITTLQEVLPENVNITLQKSYQLHTPSLEK